MKRWFVVLAIILCLPWLAHATNAVKGKGTNFVNVTFDGSTDFDLCAYLGVTEVTLYYISQNVVAVNDSLTVRNGSTTAVAIYGPFKDVTGSGLNRYFWPARVLKPYVKGSEATAGSKATFEVEYITR